jgi:hypothetical protein
MPSHFEGGLRVMINLQDTTQSQPPKSSIMGGRKMASSFEGRSRGITN